MIYVAKPDAKEKDFISLLEKSREILLPVIKKESPSALDFEDLVFQSMASAAKNTDFEGTIKKSGPHGFPDIIAKKFFGAEVKTTTKDHWTSTGNSVLESLRDEDVERIYIVFGKLGGKRDIKYRLYQECLPEVSVTHSPRYKIDMDLPIGKSIFEKMGTSYDELRRDARAIQKIKDYYRSGLADGEELWWIDQDSEERQYSPIIRPFRSLPKSEQEDFISESMALFPEMFGNKQTKFERPAAYLITKYNAVSSSLRDIFSAGGREEIKLGKSKIEVPQIAANLFIQAKGVREKLTSIDEDTLKYYWRLDKLEKNRIGQWEKNIDKHFAEFGEKTKASDIFEAGL